MHCESCGKELGQTKECVECARELQSGIDHDKALEDSGRHGPVEKRTSGILVPISKLDIGFGWLVTLSFGFCAAWGSWKAGTPNPLPGFRKLTGDAFLAWCYFLPLSGLMLWMTAKVRSAVERDYLIFIAGFLAGAGTVFSFTYAFAPFFGLMLWGSYLFRSCKL